MEADRGTRRWAVLALLLVAVSCTKLIDHNAKRCASDDDCMDYSHYHPYCRDNVCIASGLNPIYCDYYADWDALKTATQDNFLNQCSAGFLPPNMGSAAESCLDDMNRSFSPDPGIVMPGPLLPSPATTTPRPTVNCRDLVPAGKTSLIISGSSNFQPLLKAVSPS